MEDAVTFLESAKKVYSDVALLLNKGSTIVDGPDFPETQKHW